MKHTALLAFLCLAFGFPHHAWSAERPPSIVFILVDDQGYYDLGCYGATEFETPRIDAMAAEGVRFTDYYAAAPICSPLSRWLAHRLLPATRWISHMGPTCRFATGLTSQ